MKNELVGISVGIVCALVLIGTVLVPMVDEVTAETLTYTNEGMPYASVDDDTHTIVITSTTITVDGDEIDQSLFPSGFAAYTLVYGADTFIRFNVADDFIQYCYTALTSFTVGDNTVTITITGDSATITTTADSTTATMSDVLYYVSTSGTYVLSNCPYVTEDSVILGAGHTSFSTPSTVIYTVWSGTIEEISAEVLRTTNGSSVVSSTEVNTTNDTTNLYRVDSVLINYVVTYSSTDYECTSTYTYFLAPSEVVYENPDYIGDTESVLLSVIPLFTILAVLCVVTYAVMRNRD